MAGSGAFFSIWAQDSTYWLVVEGQAAARLPGFKALYDRPDLAAIKTDVNWRDQWRKCNEHLATQPGTGVGYRAGVMVCEELPEPQDVVASLKPIGDINAIAGNLWLMDYVNHGRLDCYMQRVIDRRGKQVGYEAFARMEGPDGGVIGGGAIMQAAHALRIEYQLDRLLHKQAIECFVESDLEGYIFINFLTGFIHRPEVYLDGLSQTVTRLHVRPGSVVLDIPIGNYAKDLPKLKSIAQYCRTRGFKLALDDVTTSVGLSALLAEIRPAFVKLDRSLSQGIHVPRAQGMLTEIVRISHSNGASVLAEGVEAEAQHKLYMAADVDMFQGYLFGAPERFPRVLDEVAQVSASCQGV